MLLLPASSIHRGGDRKHVGGVNRFGKTFALYALMLVSACASTTRSGELGHEP